MQLVVPNEFEQPSPQVPQFAIVFSDASQPFAAMPSQLPNPRLQVNEQVPVLQEDVALAALQDVPQAPQFKRFVLVFVSQPLFLLPSQSLNAPVQTGVQTPVTQLVVPFWFWHGVPQLPQLFVFVLVLVSQPLFRLLSQSPKPRLQTGKQAPPEQLVEPLVLLQAAPQAPQFAVLVARFASHPFTGLPSQLPKPELQEGVQVPATQLFGPLTV
jgi:hypothetical protein